MEKDRLGFYKIEYVIALIIWAIGSIFLFSDLSLSWRIFCGLLGAIAYLLGSFTAEKIYQKREGNKDAKKDKNTITINGVTIEVGEGNISIKNGKIIVDGKEVFTTGDNPKVVIQGNVNELDVAGNVEVKGNVEGSVDAGGSVTCRGVGGDVDAGGSVTVNGDVKGEVDAGGSVVVNK
jgi:hypothetical protein